MSLNDKIEEANKSEFSGGSSNWFKMKEGINQFRLLSEPEIIFENFGKGICYHQCGYEGTPKYLARILDRADNQVKLYKIPFTIFETIAGFEKDEELEFSSFPMPYDVKIKAVGAGTKEVKYTVMPSLKRVEVDEGILDVLGKQKPLKEVITAMQAKNIEKHKADGTWQKEQERLAQLKEELTSGRSSGNEEIDTIEYPTAEDEGIDINDSPF